MDIERFPYIPLSIMLKDPVMEYRGGTYGEVPSRGGCGPVGKWMLWSPSSATIVQPCYKVGLG